MDLILDQPRGNGGKNSSRWSFNQIMHVITPQYNFTVIIPTIKMILNKNLTISYLLTYDVHVM